jgi:DNA-binding PadR family transcriptional regulator
MFNHHHRGHHRTHRAMSHEGGPGGRSHRHGRDGLRRFFAHGDLRLVILNLIGEKPRHGYDIIKAIEDAVSGAYSPSPGVIYPTLTMLEELGHASVAEGDGKKRYAITPDGSAWLAANQAALDHALALIDAAGAADRGAPAPEIIRATENLKVALRLRQGRGPLTEEQTRAIAAALDAAALAIERS